MAKKSHAEGIESAERVRLLEIIDKFREYGIREDISLPQLVVIGDQSSGKSSLLEGLTGLPFPIASELCTRFATHIVFRRKPSSEETIKVSIIPAPKSSDELKEELGKFEREVTELSASTFELLLDEAARHMGLPGVHDSVEDLETRFSDHVLRIELSGPSRSHLSFVDVPGLFHNPTKYQTLQDSAIIRGLIESYAQDTRTIIMAVMDARNNLANQEVFRIAKSADPLRLRTVGIMTKCDAVQKGDEAAAIKVAQNQTERLNHGWFCVRNRTTEEIKAGVTMEARNKNEADFFKNSPFNVLDKKRTGVPALSIFLGKMLCDHVISEFPSLRQEISALCLESRKRMEELGPPCQTPQEQRAYLLKLAGSYQRRVEDALSGRYKMSGKHPSKLRMHIQNANDTFGEAMHTKGHSRKFRSTDEDMESEIAQRYDMSLVKCRLRRHRTPHPYTSSIVNRKYSQAASDDDTEDIYVWIKDIYKDSRGPELPGHVNSSVLQNLFHQQTMNWVPISMEHVDSVSVKTLSAHEVLLAQSCADKPIRDKLRARLKPFLERSVLRAKAELQRILDDEREGPLLTNNHYYADNLVAARSERVITGLKRLGYQDGCDCIMDFKAMTSVAHLSNETSAVYDIHDSLKAYYKVALKRFIDNVCQQAIERNFLGPEGPISIFGSEFVGNLSDAELASISAEDFTTSNARDELVYRISRLEKALELSANVAL
ncbi:hypothetical protein FGG08_001487 [Glutinoglossum americanum]|uniref:Uncharacterized protein n=1 Tax=Glutinoglossum americanum TaxID=1670608 RepID=A0A9P8L2P0_9PEZI|nr:hypothetical protein FGG08_001487 [Glutinoglossum americanum]